MCLHACVCVCLGQADSPVFPRDNSYLHAWREGRGCVKTPGLRAPFPAQHDSLVVTGLLSQCVLCASEALHPSRTGSLPGCHGPLLQPEALPRWKPEQHLTSGPQQVDSFHRVSLTKTVSSCARRVPSVRTLCTSRVLKIRWKCRPLFSLKVPMPPGHKREGTMVHQCQPGLY